MSDRGPIPDRALPFADDLSVSSTASGRIWLSPTLAAVVPADLAWVGIQDLHHAAIGDAGHRYSTPAVDLLPHEAFGAYSNAVTSVLAQLAVTVPDTGDALLTSLCEHVDLLGSFEGLEPIALAAYSSAERSGQVRTGMDQLHHLVGGIGLPSVGGGGTTTTPVFDVGHGRLSFPHMADVRHHVEGLVASGGSPEAIGQGIRQLAAQASPVGHHGRTALEALATGTIAGALIGTAIPGVGTVAGGAFGLVAGVVDLLFGSSASGGRGHGTAAPVPSTRGHGGGPAVPAHLPQAAARAVASGEHVTVNVHIHVHAQGERQVIAPGGTTPAPAAAHTGAPPHEPGPPRCVRPEPDRCEVEPDGTIGRGVEVRGWDGPELLGSVSPLGPGVEALAVADASGAATFAPMPLVDHLAMVVDPGELLAPVMVELSAELGAGADGVERWSRPTVDLSEGVASVPSIEQYLATTFEHLGLGPDLTIARASRLLVGADSGGWSR